MMIPKNTWAHFKCESFLIAGRLKGLIPHANQQLRLIQKGDGYSISKVQRLSKG